MQTSLNIKEPGLNTLPLGVERYIVNGGGLTGVQIHPDDEIEIINNEGNQICEITVFNKDGKSDLGILNLKEIKNSSEIKKILFNKNETSLQALYQLKKRNLDREKSKSAILFDKDTVAKETIKLLQELAIPVILCTSKTAAEVKVIRKQLNLTDPYIF